MWLNPPRTPIATSTRLEKTYHPCCVYPFHSYPSKKEMIFPPLHTSDSDFIKTNKFFHETFIRYVPYECLSHDYASSPGDTLWLQFTVLPRTHCGCSLTSCPGPTHDCNSMSCAEHIVVGLCVCDDDLLSRGHSRVRKGVCRWEVPTEEGRRCVCVCVCVCDVRAAAHNQVREHSQ